MGGVKWYQVGKILLINIYKNMEGEKMQEQIKQNDLTEKAPENKYLQKILSEIGSQKETTIEQLYESLYKEFIGYHSDISSYIHKILGGDYGVDEKTKENLAKLIEVYDYSIEISKNGIKDAYVDIQIAEKYESIGILEKAYEFYRKAKFDAEIRNNLGMSGWIIAHSLHGQISDGNIKIESDRREKEYKNIVEVVNEKIEKIKNLVPKRQRSEEEKRFDYIY